TVGGDGKITTVSKDQDNIRFDRLNADGSPDVTFGTNGERFWPLTPTPDDVVQDVIANITPGGGFAVDTVRYPTNSPFKMTMTREFHFDAYGELLWSVTVDSSRGVGLGEIASSLPDGRTLLYLDAARESGPAQSGGDASFAWFAGRIDAYGGAY